MMPTSTVQTACSIDPQSFDTNEDSRELQALCYACPLYFDCRTWAISSVEEGFAGGLSRRDRRKARKKLGVAA
jgi:hypothetical protein